MHTRSKKTLIVLKYAFIFFLFCSRLPNGSFNDSFFQTPPLLDVKLQWLVWRYSLLWLVYCVQLMSITERPSPLLSPQLGGKPPNSHSICRNVLIKHCSLYTIALFFIRTPSNNNYKHSLSIDTFLDNCERTDFAVSQLDASKLTGPEPHRESMGYCQKENEKQKTKKCRWAEGHFQRNPGFHTTSAVPQTDQLHATPNWGSN